MNTVLNLLRTQLPRNLPLRFGQTQRFYATHKRFYKNTNVLASDGKFEVTLDQRKLKTPKGTLFTVNSEALAIAVATEWNSQKESINQASMHLTALCCTALDNPNNLEKPDMVNYLLNFLATDTVLYHSQNDADNELGELQCKEWDPVIAWFNERFGTNLQKTLDITTAQVSPDDVMKVSKYLLSHREDILHGFVFAVDTLKSIVLAFAAIERFVSIEKAVHLARLEEEFQLKFWGRVEWAHDASQQELQARLAASVLFIHLNRTHNVVKEKMIL